MVRTPRILLFGPGSALPGPGQPAVPIGGPLQRALLAALALRPGRPVSVPDLVSALWGDAPPETANNALQVHISGLRQSLQPLDIRINRDGATYALTCTIGDVDVPLFDACVTSGQSTLRSGNANRARRLLERALNLAPAPLLAGTDLPAPLEQERRILEARHRSARRDLVIALYQEGETHRAVEVAQCLVDEDPLDEAAWSRLMAAQYHAGQPHAALETYREAHRKLRDELGIEPSPQLTALQLDILNHRVPTFTQRPELAPGGPFDRAVSFCWLVQPLLMQGRIAEARECLDQGLELAARHHLVSMGERFSVDAALVELAERKPAGAIGLATAVLVRHDENLLPLRMVALRCLALGHQQLGSPQLASRFLGAADALAERLGLRPESLWAPVFEPCLRDLRAAAEHEANHAIGAADPEALAKWWLDKVTDS